MRKIGIIDNLGELALIRQGIGSFDSATIMSISGGNTGNFAFVNAISKLFKNPTKRIFWYSDPASVRYDCDLIVLCCANQLGSHTDLQIWADTLSEFDLPVVLIGLGAQSPDLNKFPELTLGTLNFVKQVNLLRFSPSSANILTRGEFSSNVLDGINIPSKPYGCPSVFISKDINIGEKIFNKQLKRIEKVAIAAGNPWDIMSAKLEFNLVEIVNKYNGRYIIQHPEEMIQFALNEITLIDANTKIRFTDVYQSIGDFESILLWFYLNSKIFLDVDNWIKYLSEFDAVFGPRYHGVALGLQAGTPGCVITIDSRTEELCKTTSIKNIPMSSLIGLDSEEMIDRIVWDESDILNFINKRSENAKNYVGFLLANGIEPSDHLMMIAD